LARPDAPRAWLRVILAGFAVGMAVTEAYDIGALFSLVIAAFVIFRGLVEDGPLINRVLKSGLRLGVVAICAAVLAAATLSTLVGTQVKGVVGMSQDEATRAARWAEATQWSIPKAETLNMVVPNFYGCRMDTPDGGAYWGICGQSAAITEYLDSDRTSREVPGGWFRYGGGSGYLGMLVIGVVMWTIAQLFRGEASVFSRLERRLVCFWLVVIGISLLLMYGRFAPFYQLFYALPYASTIRNPAKFFHIVNWATLIVFAYGMNALAARYLNPALASGKDLVPQLSNWWQRCSGFERRWVKASFIFLTIGIVATLALRASQEKLVAHIAELNRIEQLTRQQPVNTQAAVDSAQATARFAVRQVFWAAGALAITVCLLAVLSSGYFNGKRVRVGVIVLGLFVVIDLGWQVRPYLVIQNWKLKYESNPVVDFLREQPYEHRVSIFPIDRFLDVRRLPREAMSMIQDFKYFSSLYDIEWKQHLFQYYNIQSLDIIQEPRMGTDKAAFESVMFFAPIRRWELTNTRYLFAPTALVDVLNKQLDPGRERFKLRLQFALTPKPGFAAGNVSGEQVTAVIVSNAPLALYDFTGALPRASLYSNWKVSQINGEALQSWAKEIQSRIPPEWAAALGGQSETDLATLKELADPMFDPANTVLLSEPLPEAAGTNQSPGQVQFKSYAPKRIVLEATTTAPSVLLLTDRYNSNWQVLVDGKPSQLLRANFIMRGVFLPTAGTHMIEFQYVKPIGPTLVSLTAIIIGFVLLAGLGWRTRSSVP